MKSIDNPPEKDGIYMVKFKLYTRNTTECVSREFINGKCTLPYYFRPFDFSKLIACLDEDE